MRRLRIDDEVIVIAGRDKGQHGNIVEFVGADRAIVSGVNMVRRHTRPRTAGERGGIITKEAPIHVSNIAIFNDELGTMDRIGLRTEDGEKVRYFKKNGNAID